MSIATAIGVLGAAMGGYAKGRQQYLDRESDEKDREQLRQERALRIAELQQQQTDRQAVRDAGQDVAVTDGNHGPMPEGQTFRVAGQGFGSLEDAQKAAAAANTPAAKRRRVLSVIEAQDPVRAATTRATLAQSDEVEKLTAAQQFARAAAGSFLNGGGWSGFAKFATDQYQDDNLYEAQEDGKGGATIVQKSADGKEIGRMTFASPHDAVAYAVGQADPSRWVSYKQQEAALASQAADRQADREYRRDVLNETKRNNMAVEGLSGERISAAGARGSDADGLKLPQAVKLRHDAIAKQLETINSAVTKAQAEGMWDPNSPNAKDLMTRQAALQLQSRQLLEPYLSGGVGAADPLGVRKPPTGAAPAVSQAVRDRDASAIRFQEAGGDPARIQREIAQIQQALKSAKGDQRGILQNELALWQGAAGMVKRQASPRPDPAQPKASANGVMAPSATAGATTAGNETAPSWLRQVGGSVAAALAPDWESQARAALKSGDRAMLQMALKESPGAAKPMTAETQAAVRAALAAANR